MISTEYNRGFHDYIRSARVMLRRIAQKRVPIRSSEIIKILQQFEKTDNIEYNAGCDDAALRISELLGPDFLPLYPGDIHEILECLDINPPSS